MKKKSLELKEHFEADLQLSEEITLEDWQKRNGSKKLQESVFRMIAPLL